MRHKMSGENEEGLRNLLKILNQNISVLESGSLRENSRVYWSLRNLNKHLRRGTILWS